MCVLHVPKSEFGELTDASAIIEKLSASYMHLFTLNDGQLRLIGKCFPFFLNCLYCHCFIALNLYVNI